MRVRLVGFFCVRFLGSEGFEEERGRGRGVGRIRDYWGEREGELEMRKDQRGHFRNPRSSQFLGGMVSDM